MLNLTDKKKGSPFQWMSREQRTAVTSCVTPTVFPKLGSCTTDETTAAAGV